VSDFNPLNTLAGLPIGLQGLNALAPGGQPPQQPAGAPNMNLDFLQQWLGGGGGHARDFMARRSGVGGMGGHQPFPGPVMTPGGGGGPGPLQGMPNTQFPLNPGQMQQAPGAVGSQLGVIGATPAGSPFGLPSY
jgi:hypothetical protein